jgi:hypothetical protein
MGRHGTPRIASQGGDIIPATQGCFGPVTPTPPACTAAGEWQRRAPILQIPTVVPTCQQLHQATQRGRGIAPDDPGGVAAADRARPDLSRRHNPSGASPELPPGPASGPALGADPHAADLVSEDARGARAILPGQPNLPRLAACRCEFATSTSSHQVDLVEARVSGLHRGAGHVETYRLSHVCTGLRPKAAILPTSRIRWGSMAPNS